MYECLHVHGHIYTSMWYTCACIWKSEVVVGIFLDDVSLDLLKQSLSFEPRDHRVRWSRQPACFRDPHPCLVSAVGPGDPNSHPHTSMTIALSTEPSSQSLSLLPQPSKCLDYKPVLPCLVSVDTLDVNDCLSNSECSKWQLLLKLCQ